MTQCHYCHRTFRGPQSVKAHLRKCPDYLKAKDGTARRTSPNIPSQAPAPATLNDTPGATPLSDVVAHFVTQMSAQFAGPDQATRLRQQRESLLALLCSNLVDWYRPPEGVVTPEMAAAAKVAILDELRTQPIEDLSHAELTLRGEVIRNRVFAPLLREQQAELKKQREVTRLEKLRTQEHTDTQARRTTRKSALIELGISRALQSASSRGFPPRVLVVLEWEIRARLDAWLVGDETESQVNEIFEAAVGRPLLEWERRVEQFQSAERQRILDKCLTVALPAVEAVVPWVQEVVVNYICTTLGMPPSPSPSTREANASPTNEAVPESPEGPTPRPVRRRRVYPSSPTMDCTQAADPEATPSTSSETRTAAS
ncbi:MAG: hypothetical protein L0Z46_00285 [Nitrospiraceae bacterium]|nr:hypothetical protein [Nitrospiraceae bacterium]